jgi:hypothetical protein
VIHFNCPKCGRPIHAPDYHAGRENRCACGVTFVTPVPDPAPTPRGGPEDDPPREPTDRAGADGTLAGTVGELARHLTGDEERRVRAALTGYADSVPHHGIADLGGDVELAASLRELRAYSVTLRSLHETRHPARREEPWYGESLPPPTVSETNVEVWGHDLPLATRFRPRTEHHPVPESREVRTCQRCAGLKSLQCGRCSGLRAVTCPSCGGSGEESCPRCSGRLWVQVRDARGHYQDVPCPCNTGRIRCSGCMGHRRVRCGDCSGCRCPGRSRGCSVPAGCCATCF